MKISSENNFSSRLKSCSHSPHTRYSRLVSCARPPRLLRYPVAEVLFIQLTAKQGMIWLYCNVASLWQSLQIPVIPCLLALEPSVTSHQSLLRFFSAAETASAISCLGLVGPLSRKREKLDESAMAVKLSVGYRVIEFFHKLRIPRLQGSRSLTKWS